MNYVFAPMNKEYAQTIVDTWKYNGDYSIYDYSNEAEHMLDSSGWGKGLFAILNESGELVGELSIEFFDEQGRYTEYDDYDDTALINSRELWIGFGLRSDLVGRGLGGEFVSACADYAVRHHNYQGEYVRLGVAIFNQRAIKAYEKAGFQIFDHTTGEISGKMFECVSMRKKMTHKISLVVFDGDDTLWYGLDGGFISGVTYQDADGSEAYTFQKVDELTLRRNDGQRFRLYSEVPAVLAKLKQRGVLISLASYNRTRPVLGALALFGLDDFIKYPVVEWHGQKDQMILSILQRFAQDGYAVEPQQTLFIDDDHSGKYRQQMAAIGAFFMQKGVDITDLNQLFDSESLALHPATKKPLIQDVALR